MAKGIGYIRVSRVGGRSGDSFISPGEQHKAIEALAQRLGIEIVSWYEELDASGGDNTRPMWNEAIDRVERGEADGLLVWNLRRFSRSVKDAANQLERIEKRAGGHLWSATEDSDVSQTSGRFARNMMFSITEMVLRQQ
jgi:site-specific DNA recombinase